MSGCLSGRVGVRVGGWVGGCFSGQVGVRVGEWMGVGVGG